MTRLRFGMQQRIYEFHKQIGKIHREDAHQVQVRRPFPAERTENLESVEYHHFVFDVQGSRQETYWPESQTVPAARNLFQRSSVEGFNHAIPSWIEMGVADSTSFPGEALTPICSECGVALCWDIGLDDYEEDKAFWDDWLCKACDPDYRKRRKKRE